MGQVVGTLIVGWKWTGLLELELFCSVYIRCIIWNGRLNEGIWTPSRESSVVFRCWVILLSKTSLSTYKLGDDIREFV